jgi:hypothetical protein
MGGKSHSTRKAPQPARVSKKVVRSQRRKLTNKQLAQVFESLPPARVHLATEELRQS